MDKEEPIRFQNTYVINLKPRGEKRIQAYGFTRDDKDGFIYLHKKDDLSDKSTFFRIKDISGFEEIPSEAEQHMPSIDDFNREYEELMRTEADKNKN